MEGFQFMQQMQQHYAVPPPKTQELSDYSSDPAALEQSAKQESLEFSLSPRQVATQEKMGYTSAPPASKAPATQEGTGFFPNSKPEVVPNSDPEIIPESGPTLESNQAGLNGSAMEMESVSEVSESDSEAAAEEEGPASVQNSADYASNGLQSDSAAEAAKEAPVSLQKAASFVSMVSESDSESEAAEEAPGSLQETAEALAETGESEDSTDGHESAGPSPACSKPEDVEPQAEVQTMQRDSDGHGEAADLWEGPHSECEVEDKESEEIADIAEASRSVTWNGTRDEAAEAANVQLLEAYRKRVKQLEAGQRKKPDMVAYKELRRPERGGIVGHVPGIPPGFRVNGKGELAILGIHCNICAGIYCKGSGPAYAIALSGGYADDHDTGANFWYTGMGGQKGGIQVADQSWDVSGNRALKLCHEQKQPVRVVRRQATSGGKKKSSIPVYIYEGLYLITEAKMEKGTHGCKICRFKMEAVPGEAIVSTKVEAVKKFKKVKLASSASNKPQLPLKRKSQSLQVTVQSKKPHLSKAAVRAVVVTKSKLAMTGVACCLKKDFTEGLEKRRIPVYGESMADLEDLPKDFCYVSSSVLDPGAAERIAAWGRAAFEWGDSCGIEAMGGAYILGDGKLTETLEWGLHECGPSCKSRACKSSRAVSRGITLPLEIFKTKTRGWGLRCSIDIPIGSFICEYAGAVCTDLEADQRCQEYLFDLDHFVLMQSLTSPDPQPNRTIYPKLPPDLLDMAASGRDVHLSIDGSSCGNVGRFINHSCNGNIVVQPVFTPGCSALHYKVALFALKEIPAYEELTYGYGWTPQENPEKEVWCSCGAENCQGRLL